MSLCDATSCGCSFEDTPFLSGVCGVGFTLFMAIIEYILKRQCDITDPCRRLGITNAPDTATSTYDFIVVGAGVAGPVVASRLSEVPQWHVLLLEAGPDEPSVTSIPSFSMSAVGTELDWNYVTEPSDKACLSTGGRCNWPRGKMVAGSSGMQGMMYTRPHRTVLDEWGRLNPGWSYDEALPYFIKSENNLNPELVEPEYHGFSGPLTVQHFPSRPVLADAVVEAAGQMGYRNGDLNGRNQTGAAVAQMMVHEGLRASTARMYLRPYVHERDNLKVGINSHVTKVLLNPTTKVAFGVQYLNKDGRIRYAFARKEVILSAGSINSPQLLLLSGVGPSKHLREVGIDVIVHLPGVGHNLHNHVSGSIGYTMDEPGTNFLTRDAVREFIDKRTGPLSSTGLTQTTILMTSKYSRQGVSDLQVFFNGYNTLCSMTGNPAECEAAGGFGNCSRRTLLARPTLTLPLSRGYLKLRSSNPLDYPLIYPNYFAVQHDVEVLVEGIKLSIELANTPALQKYGLVVNETKESGCQQHTFGTDEYFACAVKWNTGPDNHQSGSCKMGPATDAMAVVDNELRVHGVRNLRVVDASIFPRVPNSNPTATIVMAAEKLSDMVKSSWRRGCY